MSPAFTGIDHCMIVVSDLDAAAARYRRLGFTLTPRGTHSAFMGTGNYCVMFHDDYLELLGILQPTDANAARMRALARDGEGLKEMALAGPSADAARDAFAAAGLDPLAPIEFSRPVKIGGDTRDAKFRVTRLPFDKLPGLNLFMCQHYTRDVVWLPEYRRHANGVHGVAGLIVAAADPAAMAVPYAKLFGSRITAEGDGVSVGAGHARLRFVRREQLATLFPSVSFRSAAPFVAALELASDDPKKAAAHLAKEKVTYHRATDGAIEVPSTEACGVLIRFVPG